MEFPEGKLFRDPVQNEIRQTSRRFAIPPQGAVSIHELRQTDVQI